MYNQFYLLQIRLAALNASVPVKIKSNLSPQDEPIQHPSLLVAEARLQHARIRVQEELESLLRCSPDNVDQSDLLVVSSFVQKNQTTQTLDNFFFKKMGQTHPLFRLFSVFSNKHYNFTTNICEKMSIQYTEPGFEPMAFGM